MLKEILTFGDIETEDSKSYRHEGSTFSKDADIEKVLVCNKISSGEKSYKYFIGGFYNDEKVKPLHIMLPRTSAYIKPYNGCIFLIEDGDLLEKDNTIWDKVRADIKKEFDSDLVYKKSF